MGKFPIVRQLDSMDCGAACLAMVTEYYGLDYSLAQLREITFVDREGVSLLNIKSAAEKIGLETLPVKVDYQKLQHELPLPAIAHWDQNHFVVVYEVNDDEVWIGDPALGDRKISRTKFIENWGDIEANEGVLLLLENPEIEEEYEVKVPDEKPSAEQTKETINEKAVPTKSEVRNAEPIVKTVGAMSIFGILKGNRKFWWHAILGSVILLLIYLFLPLVIKELVDSGALMNDVGLLQMGLFAFAMLGLGRIVLELSRNWIFQQEAALTNAKLVSNYLEKLTQQPIRFFEKRIKWDILQRVYDNYKVGEFFQSSSIQALFYITMLLSSSIVFFILAPKLFLIFVLGICCQLIALLLFRRKRLLAKQELMQSGAQSQDLLFEIINGITAIKMNNAEQYNQKYWEQTQAELLVKRLNFTKIDQTQKSIIKLISWGVELGILYVALNYLIHETISIGSLMAVIYILAYSKDAIVELFDLLIDYQEVKLSLRRLSELTELRVKEYDVKNHMHLSTYKDILIEGVSFKYGDVDSPIVLDNAKLIIPKGKKTALVGVSGAGKTTLVKLLVGMYVPNDGNIKIGKVDVQDVHPSLLHERIAVVFEEGHLFSDSIRANITMMDTKIDKQQLDESIRIACLNTFMDRLPLGLNTRVGEDGMQLSKGQKQQVLLARAFYKKPEILIFDEATNALDGITERRLLKNIDEAFADKTTVFVAHRLNIIKNADQIVVLHKGIVVEQGTHQELVDRKGAYFLILRNDLE